MHLASPTASNMLVFGAGAQSIAHVDLIVAIRPSIQHVHVWNRSKERLEHVLNLLREKHENITFTGLVGQDASLEDAVRSAQIICTCTNSYVPIFDGHWVQPGTHINSVGSYTLDMEEIDQTTVALPRKIVVDSRDACKIEAGEHVRAVNEGRRNPDTDWIEISALVKHPEVIKQVRDNEDDVTIFKSVGVSAQDVAIAEMIVKRAETANIGQMVEN
jgi:ornithine cyclodeaminase